jgi:uncharacterized membrane protein YjfL (UPF0719 family)
MVGEIFHELAQAIKNNHAAVLAILGSLAGYVTNFLLERWRRQVEK